MQKYEHIIVETPEEYPRVGFVRLNRPKALNSLNSELIIELMNALNVLDKDNQVGAIVITGSDKAFAAGADIKEMSEASAVDVIKSDHIAPLDQFKTIGKPIIAAVSGWCLGGGNEVAMACDIILASESAKFGQPEINLGVIPGAGGTQRLTKAVGKSIAMEMVLNNRTLSADEALHYGLVSRVLPVETYMDETMKLAVEIAARAPIAIRLAKEAVNHSFESFLQEGVADERRSFHLLFSTQDKKEGMQAFVEKRKPDWKGK